ncbi:MAG: hypothetical protein LWW85_07075 [Marinilabiliales bacterium]|nr:hypothetical protein [Marinilabiliales bacterium]
MKKVLSILLVAIAFLAGMHLTLTAHFCCGELSEARLSVAVAHLSCGMGDNDEPDPANGAIHTNCCKNKVVVCSTDVQQVKASVHLSLPDFSRIYSLPVAVQTLSTESSNVAGISSRAGPPLQNNPDAVSLDFICVYLI